MMITMYNWSEKVYSIVRVATALPLRYWQLLVYGILGLWAVVIVVLVLDFLVYDRPDADDVATVAIEAAGSPQSRSQLHDPGTMRGWRLFGQAAPTTAAPAPAPVLSEQEVNAEETSLQLILNGIVAATEQKDSKAIITFRNEQSSYQVGEKLPAGNQVTISKILLDRVILNNEGKYESLFLYDEIAKPATPEINSQAENPSGMVSDARSMAQLRQMTGSPVRVIGAIEPQPSGAPGGFLIEAMTISMANDEQGKMLGFRLQPKTDQEQLTKLGLQANDIVTRINDLSLQSPETVVQAYQILKTSSEAHFTVLRNGGELELQVQINNS